VAVTTALMGVAALVLIIASDHGESSSDGLAAFNSCVVQHRFLAVTRHRHSSVLIETIDDRGHHALVAQVAPNRPRHRNMLGGAAAADAGYLMSTATPLGRDATAIENCWDSVWPVAG
jgi:hypothetical protein